MKPRRIICIGNRYCASDAAGWQVLQRLRETPLPAGVEAIDGGLGGLNLLGLVESSERVVFVDQVRGCGGDGDVVVLDAAAFCDIAPARYGHGGGLAYLLQALAATDGGALDNVTVVGVEGSPDAACVERASACALEAARRRSRTGVGAEHAQV